MIKVHSKHIHNTIVRGLVGFLVEIKVYLIDCPYPSTPLQVPIQEFVKMGITKRENGLKKIEKWLNSDDGKDFLIKQMNSKYDWTNEI